MPTRDSESEVESFDEIVRRRLMEELRSLGKRVRGSKIEKIRVDAVNDHPDYLLRVEVRGIINGQVFEKRYSAKRSESRHLGLDPAKFIAGLVAGILSLVLKTAFGQNQETTWQQMLDEICARFRLDVSKLVGVSQAPYPIQVWLMPLGIACVCVVYLLSNYDGYVAGERLKAADMGKELKGSQLLTVYAMYGLLLLGWSVVSSFVVSLLTVSNRYFRETVRGQFLLAKSGVSSPTAMKIVCVLILLVVDVLPLTIFFAMILDGYAPA